MIPISRTTWTLTQNGTGCAIPSTFASCSAPAKHDKTPHTSDMRMRQNGRSYPVKK